MNKTLVVVPTYNERENLPPLSQRLMSLPVEVDMLVVDDNSPDGTGKLADEIAARNPRLHVLHRTEKNGLGRAYIAGFRWALEQGYEFIFELDGDLSHNPDDIPMFLGGFSVVMRERGRSRAGADRRRTDPRHDGPQPFPNRRTPIARARPPRLPFPPS